MPELKMNLRIHASLALLGVCITSGDAQDLLQAFEPCAYLHCRSRF